MKHLNKTIIPILAALLLLASCSPRETQAETEEGTSAEPIIQTVTAGPSDTPSADVDLSALTPDVIEAWANEEPFDFAAANNGSYVRLGQTEGLAVTKASPVLTDEEFEIELDALMENYSYDVEITDRDVEEGDVVRADFVGYKDGTAFSGGTAYDQEITAQARRVVVLSILRMCSIAQFVICLHIQNDLILGFVPICKVTEKSHNQRI